MEGNPPLSKCNWLHFSYLDLHHFLQFPISFLVACLLVSCLLLDTSTPCTLLLVPLHPTLNPTHKPHLHQVFIVSLFTLISMLTPSVHSAPVHSATFLCYGQPSTPHTPPGQLTLSPFIHTLLYLNPSAPVHIPTPPPNLT